MEKKVSGHLASKGLKRSITVALLAALAAAPLSYGVSAESEIHYVSIKSDNKGADSNYGNDGAEAENSIAIGPSVKTTGKDNIVIGSGELSGKKGVTSFEGNRVLVVGHGNYFQPTSDRNGQPVSYRDSAIIGHDNKLLQGNADDAGGGTPAYQIIHGWKNTLKGSFTGAIGYENEIKNSCRPNHVSQNMAFAIGTENTIDATGYYMGDKNRVNTLPDYKEPGSNPNIVGADLYVIGRHNIIGSSKGGEWYVTSGHIIGTGNVIYSDSTNVFGDNNKVYSGSGIAIGNANKVGIDNAGNLVKNEYGRAIYSPVAVGHGNIVTGNYGVALGVTAESRGEKATAVGSTAYALSDYSAAMGSENRASGYGSVAVGSLNNTYEFDNPRSKWHKFDSGKYSSAVGVQNISTGAESSAVGVKNKALGMVSSSFGYLNVATGERSSAVGYWNKADGEKSSSFGYLNIATGKQSSALGFRNYATAENSAAIGIYNNKYNVVTKKWEDQTAGDYSVAIGAKNHSAGGYSSALGYENMSGGSAASAVGYRNITDGQSASALGYANIAASVKSSAVGYRNFISGYGAVAVGSENNLNFVKDYQATGFVESGDLSVALGISNATTGRKSMGIGSSNYALGTKSAAIGMHNYSTGYETLAIGHYALSGSEDASKINQVKYSAAVGSRAKSTITDAVAIGSFSNTTRDKGDYGYNPSLKKVVTDADITTDTNIGTYRAELEAARAAWQTSVEDAEIVLHKIQTQQYETKEEGQQLEAQYDQLKADSEQKQQAYDAAQKKVGNLVGAWQGQMAALSVGDEETGRTRQITGVAAGSNDTDAVNVAQLRKVADMAASATVDIEAGDNITATKDANTGKYKISATDTTLKAGDKALSVEGSKLNLSIEDTKGTKVMGSVDLKTLQSAVDTNTTYTMKGTENKDNTTTISITDSNGKEQKVTVATKDTNTYTTGGTYDAETKKLKFTQNDPSKNYEVDVSAMINNVVDTNTTYTLEGKEDKKKNTTTIALKGSDGKEQKVTVATKDTRNTIVESDTIAVKGTTQKDGSTEYKLNVKTNGKVEKDNKGIVTGGTVYKETRIEKDGNYIKKNNTAGENLIALDKQLGINTGNINKNTETINILGKQVGNLDTRINRVGAGAAALAGLHPLDFDPDDKWDFAAGYGNYKGANAAAIGAYYRPNEDTMFSIGGSFGGGENMVSAGISVKLGKGSEYMKLSRAEMAQKLEEQSKEIREMKAKDKERDAQMQEIMRQLELLQKQAGK